jgi:hypothetical protein
MPQVILHRQPYLPNVAYDHPDARGAARRAYALGELHSAYVQREGDTHHVWAQHVYAKRPFTPYLEDEL